MKITEIKERPSDAPRCAELFRIEEQKIGLRAYLAIQDNSLGPAFGGLRRRVYKSDEEAILEVLGLARGMAQKLAFAGLQVAGAKAVILDQSQLEPSALYEALGAAMQVIGPIWVAGPDMGTDKSQLDILRQNYELVNATSNNPAVATANGVLCGLRAASDFLFGSPRLQGRRVLIQGLGSVGSAIAEALLQEDARLSISELKQVAVEARIRFWSETGHDVEFHSPSDFGSYQGDVFMPCALGGILDVGLASQLDTRIICGSANEILSEPGVAGVLHDRGVLLVPDFCVNAGAVIEGVVIHQEGESGRERAQKIIDQTGERVTEMLKRARDGQLSPYEMATTMASELGR